MIDFNDKRLNHAKKLGFVKENDPEFEYTFVGAFLKKYPDRAGVLQTIKEVVGHTPEWEDLTDRTLKELRDAFAEKMCANSLRSTFLKIKAVINDNRHEVYIPTKRFKDVLKQKAEPSKNIFLTKDEIDRFAKVETRAGKERLVQTIFLISCFTGCRHSDAVNIKKENIENGVLHYVSIKTSKLAYIKSSEKLEKLIELKDLLYLAKTSVSENAFNKMVRNIARRAGINERVSVFNAGKELIGEKWQFVKSHTGRRSFVTNKLLEGYPLEKIMLAAGHTSIDMTQRYICSDAEAI